MNSIGNTIRLTLFGSSHGPNVGCVLDGLPEDLDLDLGAVKHDIARRSAANYAYATPRHEEDDFTFVREGGRLTMVFPNREQKRSDYRRIARPSHADYAAFMKYGESADLSGGGVFSGRMTLPLTAAGAVCRRLLNGYGVSVFSHILRIGELEDAPFDRTMTEAPELDPFFPLVDTTKRGPMEELITKTRGAGDTLSAALECAALGLSAGLGDPLFGGVEGRLSQYLFMIPGLRGVEFGDIAPLGSLMNDCFTEGGRTVTNRSFGVNGGLTNGMPLIVRVWFRPVPSVSLPQTGFDLIEKKPVPLTITGRHDTCILPRGAVAVEAAVCLALADMLTETEKNHG